MGVVFEWVKTTPAVARAPGYMGEMTAKIITASVNSVRAAPMPIVALASFFLSVAANKIAPIIRIVTPKAIPKDSGIVSFLDQYYTEKRAGWGKIKTVHEWGHE